MGTAHRPHVVVLDNYDSFTFNLVQYLGELGAVCQVIENDVPTVDAVRERRPHGIVVSPGPGTPEQAGISIELIRELGSTVPMLGVCLGHQAIACAFGGRVARAAAPVHGKVSLVRHDGFGLFRDVPSPFAATRYHSLVVDRASLPPELEVSAETDSGEVMGLRHRHWRLEGLQFHPESILTEHGPRLVQNWLSRL